MKTAGNLCQACVDNGCVSCESNAKNQCKSCAANFYLSEKACTACAAGKYSASGATECKDCEDTNCADCTAENTCKTCKDTYGVTVDKKCELCSVRNANCLTCSIANLGQCTKCEEGFDLFKGVCRDPNATPIKKAKAVKSKLRYGMTMEEYLAYGGSDYFGASLAEILKIRAEQLEVYDVQPGSVIVLFRVYTVADSTVTTDDLSASINNAFESGDLQIFGDAGIIDAPTTSVSAGECALGQYEDSTGTCQNCSEDCLNCISATECNKKDHKLGAILGGVLGGLAFILVIAVLILKKDALLSLGSAKSARSTKYNLANSSPTSPTVPNDRV